VDRAIEIDGLTKEYGDVRALTDLTLHVNSGEVFGFLGPNGAGKTTTIRLLLALQRPTRGCARVLGLDAQSDAVAIHRRIGYLPGELRLYDRMTGCQHIEWFQHARRIAGDPLAWKLAARFEAVLDQPVRELSKGNRQKIGLVLALMAAPQLVILDEPTSGLDPLMQREFERVMRETVAEGRTVFLSSHDLDGVQRIADRVAIVRSGRLVAIDSVERLRATSPRRIEATFNAVVDPAWFAILEGVRVTSWEGAHIALQVTGPLAPVLQVLADREPADVSIGHTDLEELFLQFYQTNREHRRDLSNRPA
jgi:ABC-2 type transport system ATP-binding protein